MDIKKIESKINNRKTTHYGNMHDVGIILDQIPTKDLMDYYVHLCGGSEISLRYFLEQGIFSSVGNKNRNPN